MLKSALLFLSGSCCFLLLPETPAPILFGLAPVCLLFFTRYCLLQCLGIFLAGFLWTFNCAYSVLQHSLPRQLEGKDLFVSGQVASIPVKRPDVTRYVFEVTNCEFNSHKISQCPEKIRINWYSVAQQPAAGEKWQLVVRLKRPVGFSNPGGFDYEQWLFQQRITAVGYVRNDLRNQRLSFASRFNIDAWRESVKNRLFQLDIPISSLAIIQALVLGDRSAMTSEQWQVLTRTGTNHLLAISGLHIGLVFGLVYFLTRWCASILLVITPLKSVYPVATVCAVLAAVVYAAMAGFSYPTQRALIMICVACLMYYRGRSCRHEDVFAMALLAVMVFDPLAPLSTGFWLSFLAVLIILMCIGYRVNRSAKILQFARVQLAIGIGLIPVLAICFHQIPVLGLLSNFLAIPWISLVTVPTALSGTAIQLLHPELGLFLFTVCSSSLEILWWILEVFAALPLAHLHIPGLTLAQFSVLICSTAILLLPGGLLLRSSVLLFITPLLLLIYQNHPSVDFELTVLDVGQGQSIVIKTRNHVVLYDTGDRFGPDFTAGSAVIIPYLRIRGIRHIDILIQSHGDRDHIGGAVDVLNTFPPNAIVTSVVDKFTDHAAQVCRKDTEWVLDQVQFSLLHPAAEEGFQGNNASCVLSVSNGYVTALLPGDIEREAELSLLLHQNDNLDADILVAPHHGSTSSSSWPFIRAVSPRYTVFSTGYGNRFGFPRPEIVHRYQQLGSKTISSHQSGAITFEISEKSIRIKQHRQIQRRFWHTMP